MANEKRLIDADAMKHRMEAHIATAIYKGIKNVPTFYESCNPTEYLKGYERGAIETANLALGQPFVDAVEVVRGEWLEDYETFVQDNGYESEPIQTGYICSECGKDGSPNWRYCPNCGANMMDGDGNA